jgi:hypothetical protein
MLSMNGSQTGTTIAHGRTAPRFHPARPIPHLIDDPVIRP